MALTLTARHYVKEDELVSEGLLSSSPSAAEEARIEMLAETASRYIDKVTRRHFWDRTYDQGSELYVDGRGGKHLHIKGSPLISVERVEIRYAPDSSWSLVSSTSYEAYLHDPIDNANADNPKLIAIARIDASSTRTRWPKGNRNIRLRCHTGFLDDDDETPLPIRRAAMRLIAREVFETMDDDGAAEVRAVRAGEFQSKSTHNRSITLGELVRSGAYTGDRMIDAILHQYRLPVL